MRRLPTLALLSLACLAAGCSKPEVPPHDDQPEPQSATAINSADPTKPTVKPVPYVGVQFVAIPEFQGLGTTVGQLFSAALAGQMSVDDALKQAQEAATATMTEGGYIK